MNWCLMLLLRFILVPAAFVFMFLFTTTTQVSARRNRVHCVSIVEIF